MRVECDFFLILTAAIKQNRRHEITSKSFSSLRWERHLSPALYMRRFANPVQLCTSWDNTYPAVLVIIGFIWRPHAERIACATILWLPVAEIRGADDLRYHCILAFGFGTFSNRIGDYIMNHSLSIVSFAYLCRQWVWCEFLSSSLLFLRWCGYRGKKRADLLWNAF